MINVLFLTTLLLSNACNVCRVSQTINSVDTSNVLYNTNDDGSETSDYIIDFGESNSTEQQQNLVSFEGDDFVPNSYFMNSYYRFLKDNMPRNRVGICGYTGIAMLMSFYDSYWNDDFICEEYDSGATTISSTELYYDVNTNPYDSPGVYNNIPEDAYTMTEYDNMIHQLYPSLSENDLLYKQLMDMYLSQFLYQQIDNQTFLGQLFSIALSNNILTPHYDSNGNVINSGYLTGFGVNYNITNTILNNYLDSNTYLYNHVSTVTSKMLVDIDNPITHQLYISEKQRIRNEIIEIIQSGRPVLVGGNGWEDSNNNGIQESSIESEATFGHIVVAYDYDVNNDIIYGNFGWSGNSVHRDLDSYFNIHIHDYWALFIDGDNTKNLTNNYYFSNKTAYYFPGSNTIYNTIQPTSFGFPDSYNQSEISSYLTINSLVPNGTNEIVNVKRVRTGYIHSECINLSTKRRSPGIAYLELDFPRDIRYLTIDISWWSNNEMVTYQNSQYYIQGKDGSFYYNYVDIWYENISTDRTHPTRLKIEFEQGVDTIRFYGSTTNYVNDRNKGRLSLFDMTVEYWDLTI